MKYGSKYASVYYFDVAPRKGSVDGNDLVISPHDVGMVAPRKGSVDGNLETEAAAEAWLESLPARGAWIEI